MLSMTGIHHSMLIVLFITTPTSIQEQTDGGIGILTPEEDGLIMITLKNQRKLTKFVILVQTGELIHQMLHHMPAEQVRVRVKVREGLFQRHQLLRNQTLILELNQRKLLSISRNLQAVLEVNPILSKVNRAEVLQNHLIIRTRQINHQVKSTVVLAQAVKVHPEVPEAKAVAQAVHQAEVQKASHQEVRAGQDKGV